MKFTDFKISIEKSWGFTRQVLVLIILGVVAIIVFGIICFPKDIYAQEQPKEVPKPAQRIITPQVDITSLSLSKTELKAGEEITGAFTAKGVGDKVLPGIIYRLVLYKYIETGEMIKVGEEAGKEITVPKKEQEVFGEEYGEKTLTIIPQKEEAVDFSYKLPPIIPSDEYFFEVELLNEMGQKWTSEYLKIKIEGVDSFLSIRDAWILQGESKFEPLIGRGFSPGQEAKFQFEIINSSEKEITAVPKITIYPRFSNSPPFKEYSEGEIFLAHQEKKVLTYNLPKIESPESYLGNLVFYDKTSNLPISNIQSFRWVIEGETGEVAKILSLTSDKAVYKKGEKAKIFVSYTGPILPTAPRPGAEKSGNLLVTIYDNENKKVGEGSLNIDLARLDEVTLEIPIKKDVFSPKIEAKILNKEGKELDSYSVVSESKETPPAPRLKNIMYLIPIIIIALIVVFWIAYQQFKKKKPTLPLFIFIFFISSLCLFLFPQITKATRLVSCTYTDSRGGYYVCGEDDPNLTGLTWNWNSPSHSQSFMQGANSGSEPLLFSGDVEFSTCINAFDSNETSFWLQHARDNDSNNWLSGDWDRQISLRLNTGDIVGDGIWDADFAVPWVEAGYWLAVVKIRLNTDNCPSGYAPCYYDIEAKEHIIITPAPPPPISISTYAWCLDPIASGITNGASSNYIGWSNAALPAGTTKVEIHRCQNPPCTPVKIAEVTPPTFTYYDKNIPQDTTTANYRYQIKAIYPTGSKTSDLSDVTSHPKYGADFYAQWFDFTAPPAEIEVLPGKTWETRILMRNMGCAHWNWPGEADVFFLGSQNPQENSNWGLQRVGVPETTPGNGYDSSVWFTFNTTAPMTPGTYNFQWQIVREQGASDLWFGKKSSNVTIKVVPPPSPGFSISIAKKTGSDPAPPDSGAMAKVRAGLTQEYTVTVTSNNGFSGKVNLLAAGGSSTSLCNKCLQACGTDPFGGCDSLSIGNILNNPLKPFCLPFSTGLPCDTSFPPATNFYQNFWCHKCDVAGVGYVPPPNGMSEWGSYDYLACAFSTPTYYPACSNCCSPLTALDGIHFSPGPRDSVTVPSGGSATKTLSITPAIDDTPSGIYDLYVQGVHNTNLLQGGQEKIATTQLEVVADSRPIAIGQVATSLTGGPMGSWWDQITINAGSTAYFRDGGSSDPDGGTIKEYKWDFTNNGFDVSDIKVNPNNDFTSSSNGTTQRAYLNTGTYTARYRVTDDEGTTGLGSVTIIVTGNPPLATNLNATPGDYCFAASPSVSLNWTFSDPDAGDTQSAYQVQVDNNSDFSSPEVDSGKVISSNTTYSPNLFFGITYNWRVKVWDSSNTDSSWAIAPIFSTPRPPWPDFSWLPLSPAAGSLVQFTDKTTFYGSNPSWAWDFDNSGGVPDATVKNPSFEYPAAGDYTVKLTASDSKGTCSKTVPIKVISNAPSAVPFNATQGNYCFAASPPIFLNWTFSDPDAGDTQSAYQVQVDNNSDFSSPEVDSGKVSNSSTEYPPPNLSFGITYNWQVKVWDSSNTDSSWAIAPIFSTSSRPPWPDFSWEPLPVAGSLVPFTDKTTFYGSNPSWVWDFDNSGTIDSTVQNPSFRYPTDGDYTVKLTATDSGGTCPGEQTITVGPGTVLPEWREIQPK